MILTFLYMIATSIQARRILFLKTHLRNVFQGNAANYPSIVFYNKALNSHKDASSSTDNYETGEFVTSCLCTNKKDARLEELLWYHGDMRLCTIYPQQKVDVSSWLAYQYGRTFFPLHTNNRIGISFQQDCKLYILVEADVQSYTPAAATKATKIEDYGLIITWTTNKNLAVIIESDLDMVAKFFITAMEGQCYINNGLLLKRIETVLMSGKPCSYKSDLLNLRPTGSATSWKAHVEKLRILSHTAKLASDSNKSLEIEDIPGIVIYPENTVPDTEKELMQCVKPNETLETERRSQDSTATSISTPEQENQSLTNKAEVAYDNVIQHQSVSYSGSGLFDTLDSEETPNVKQFRQTSDSDIKNINTLSGQKDSYHTRESKVTPFNHTSKTAMEDVITKLLCKSQKPPNVLIYADSIITLNNVKSVLEESLGTDKYAIYGLSLDEAHHNAWIQNAALVVVCGNVDSEIGRQIIEYVLHGGKLLALCSDVLHILLPLFKTEEVRENELVYFSYGKWKHVRMMHHIFCYQASPVRTKFSHDQEDFRVHGISPPTSVDVKDKTGNLHSFNVKVLGAEETWHTPSILLATYPKSGGKVVFSQIHLEVDPMQYEFEESKFAALKESNVARLEIFNDLLNNHLGIELCNIRQMTASYTPAFFLGHHENLTSKKLGRLVIYADVLTSSMDVVDGLQLQHGLAVICRQQNKGRGRSKNIWLSPQGCAMFTLQIHVLMNTILGKHISLLQHVISVAIVSALKSLPGYEELDLRLKWPNDIYAGNNVKIGGIIINTHIVSGLNICNAGVGVNLFNKTPTCCINDIITMFNKMYNKSLPIISFEQYFAIVFNEIEKWLNIVQSGDLNTFLDVYYAYWMHTDQEVTVTALSGTSQRAKILGIDDFGYLRVRGEEGNIFTVHPDGNSFDCIQGLIIPK
ncbi:holocarboxylase synthetase-like protein isoform X2 [Calliopsis andreniformis]|uniref:holocarboxylase synthetase-like protein isoform X2 n=1 Tax=Calliopsis andreniformis TaxID=337506 RepID=UPI003FCC3203